MSAETWTNNPLAEVVRSVDSEAERICARIGEEARDEILLERQRNELATALEGLMAAAQGVLEQARYRRPTEICLHVLERYLAKGETALKNARWGES